MRSFLSSLSRVRNRYTLAVDFLILLASFCLAFWFRTGAVEPWRVYAEPLAFFALAATVLKLGIFYRMEMYAQYWPYASVRELLLMFRALAAGAMAELFLVQLGRWSGNSFVLGIPRSALVLDGLLSSCFVGATRLSIRAAQILTADARADDGPQTPVIIVGAGVAGAMVVKELLANEQVGRKPVGYVDDDQRKIGKSIHGVKVLGTLKDLPLILKRTKVKDVIIAIPTAPGKLIRQVVQACEAAGVTSKTVPGLFEIIRGTSRIDQVRNVQLEDLLRRGAVRSDEKRVMQILSGARVMVTGAGGSIGSEICRQIMEFGPSELLLVGHGENSIFHIAAELRGLSRAGVRVTPLIADIRDRRRMEHIFASQKPGVVFHAAAHKHLPLMEVNLPDAVTNNVLGTSILVDLALEAGTERLVMISTDKAVNPTSILGVTKRIAEMIVHDAGSLSGRKFVAVRFGNVLGSRGSVVPIFERQIRAGGPITVTHPEVKRFFMTIPEAVELVLQSAAMGRGGDLFVLDMGEQIKIIDLARDLLRLNGLQEGRDIDIVSTGLTPGEKMSEELFFEEEKAERTAHEKILVCHNGLSGEIVGEGQAILGRTTLLDTLIRVTRRGDVPEAYRCLHQLVPHYKPPVPVDGGGAWSEVETGLLARKERILHVRVASGT